MQPIHRKGYSRFIFICIAQVALLPAWSVATYVTLVSTPRGIVGLKLLGVTVMVANKPELSVAVGKLKPAAAGVT